VPLQLAPAPVSFGALAKQNLRSVLVNAIAPVDLFISVDTTLGRVMPPNLKLFNKGKVKYDLLFCLYSSVSVIDQKLLKYF